MEYKPRLRAATGANICYAQLPAFFQQKSQMPSLSFYRLYRICLLLFTLLLVATGCGQKGDLYLPDKTHASQSSPAGPA